MIASDTDLEHKEYIVNDLGAQEQLSRDGTFSHRTETVLRDMILDGSIPAGERLNEVALASALGISRGPLREAVQRLAGEGLLTVVSHRGAFVRTFEKREVEELYDLRTALETYVTRLVCERASAEQIAGLVQLVDEAGTALSGDSDAAYPSAHDFHAALLTIAHHSAIERTLRETQRQISLARGMSAKGPDRARKAQDEHHALVEAIEARDADRAANLMRAHLEEARRSAMSALGLENPKN